MRYDSGMNRLEELSTMHRQALAAFCQKWKVHELALFGSVLRDDFGSESDIDVLITFEPRHAWSAFDHFEMERELSELFGRRVELTSRMAVETSPNWIRKQAILGSAQTLYAA